MTNITIAGASGFVGTNLLKRLSGYDSITIKALSRYQKESHSNINWCETDLFSLSSTIEALKNTDIAVFFVHSMMPSTRLFQGSFRDTDLIIADNFIRACRRNNVKKIIYLGGVIPEGKSSEHLESRKEVEETFLTSGIPSLIIRAGLVVGDGGSSFEILKNLSHNLPLMILPKWTKSLTQTIFLDDLLDYIEFKMKNINEENEVINAVSGEQISYGELIKKTNEHVSKNKLMIPIPINYTTLSKFWVSTFGQSDMSLVSPLIDSLLCDISNIKPSDDFAPFIQHKSYKQMLQKVSIDKLVRKKKRSIKETNSVRSIQRIATGKYYDIKKVADYYFEWLPSHMRYLIHVDESGENVYFRLKGLKSPLLILEYIKCQANHDRAKFHIVGGILTQTNDTGWLEFRNIDQGKFLLASINEFRPALPWFIYKYTQAMAHELVMDNFKKDLLKKL